MDVRTRIHQRHANQPRMRRHIRESAVVPAPPSRRTASAGAIIRVMRPLQWIKNATCFAGLLFSGKIVAPGSALDAATGFWSFCFASSAVYIFNDIVDRHKDRLNPRTANRPIASGQLSPAVALLCAVFLAMGAGVLAKALGTSCLLVLVSYFVLNLLYSYRLKHVAIADVMCIASGFVLRVLFGVYAVGSLPTPWIALCMFFLAMFLGFAKRRAELVGLADQRRLVRPVLGQYDECYLNMALMMSAASAVLAYSLFTVTTHKNPTLVITVVPVAYCVNRYLLQVVAHGEGSSPDRLLLSDRRLWIGIGSWIVLYATITCCHIELFSAVG